LLTFTGLTIATARFAIAGGDVASRATVAMIFLYPLAFNPGFNALTYGEYSAPYGFKSRQLKCTVAYLVELFPYRTRARGITIFQAWTRSASFFNQFVNPIGLKNLAWKYYISYCVWIVIEVLFIFFLFPETHGKTLEELAFCKFSFS